MAAELKYVPPVDDTYVATSLAETLETVLGSKMFYPVLLTGHTGIGKTFEPMQICARVKREIVRVNISSESDEDSLMGGLRLEDGSTYFNKGPVIEAMERGAILLLDELDLGNPMRIMCLQSVLEGQGYLIKKTGEYVRPKDGFNVIATGNTKGAGDETGLYVGTQILNEAFLDRFPIVIDVPYPDRAAEISRIEKLCSHISLDFNNTKVKKDIDTLLNWTFEIRKANENDQADSECNISSRRLGQIMRTYKMFGENMREAVRLSINRFDKHHQEVYLKSYDLLANPEEKLKKEKMASKQNEDFLNEMRKYKSF